MIKRFDDFLINKINRCKVTKTFLTFLQIPFDIVPNMLITVKKESCVRKQLPFFFAKFKREHTFAPRKSETGTAF